eukprot:CAMPEP_0179007294 /NCGR_PEP_ID=MMETSP0795-20121207/15084_1 /TAXON_ID=88552 /ORGANISM="Amoebophrya sp., Strain Ameob2" /LENGTH=788 /DNA_ID=CAMNT_0020702259 /DNA_START=169 /DNA_END=2537 /DNA_ORIENTATION=-
MEETSTTPRRRLHDSSGPAESDVLDGLHDGAGLLLPSSDAAADDWSDVRHSERRGRDRVLADEVILQLLAKSDFQGCKRLFLHLCVLGGTGSFIHYCQALSFAPGAAGGHVVIFLWLPLLLAALFTHGFVLQCLGYCCQHECMHRSAFRTKWLNDWVGFLVSVSCFEFFCHEKLMHKQHHTFTGDVRRDPEITSFWPDLGRSSDAPSASEDSTLETTFRKVPDSVFGRYGYFSEFFCLHRTVYSHAMRLVNCARGNPVDYSGVRWSLSDQEKHCVRSELRAAAAASAWSLLLRVFDRGNYIFFWQFASVLGAAGGARLCSDPLRTQRRARRLRTGPQAGFAEHADHEVQFCDSPPDVEHEPARRAPSLPHDSLLQPAQAARLSRPAPGKKIEGLLGSKLAHGLRVDSQAAGDVSSTNVNKLISLSIRILATSASRGGRRRDPGVRAPAKRNFEFLTWVIGLENRLRAESCRYGTAASMKTGFFLSTGERSTGWASFELVSECFFRKSFGSRLVEGASTEVSRTRNEPIVDLALANKKKDVYAGLEPASSSSSEKALRKDKEFREYLVHSGAADSMIKLITALREHEAFAGSGPFPLPIEEKTGILQLLFDYYGSKPEQPIWDEIDHLRKSSAAMRDNISLMEKSVTSCESELLLVKRRAHAVRAWKYLGNAEGTDTRGGEGVPQIVAKESLTGKDVLIRLIGAYKKVPHAALVELPSIEKKYFLRKAETDDRLAVGLVPDVIERLKDDNSPGPAFTPEDLQDEDATYLRIGAALAALQEEEGAGTLMT